MKGFIVAALVAIADFLLASKGNRTAAPRTGEPAPQASKQPSPGEMKWKLKGF